MQKVRLDPNVFYKRFLVLIPLALAAVLLTNGQTPSTASKENLKRPAAAAGAAKKAIICLTYDDGLESQLATVIPQLDSAGFKGTFFLNSIKGASEQIGEASPAITGWTNAAARGHELANHTLFHACPEQLGWAKSLSIETYTTEKLYSEIRTQNSILALLDPKRKSRSFAYPCNNFMIGSTDYSKQIKAQGLVTYGRAGGDRTSGVTDFAKLDVMKVPSWMVEENTTAEDLIAFAEKLKSSGGLGIYQFHSVDGKLFKISKESHLALLNYLRKNEGSFWVTTFSEAMEFITKK